MNLLKSELWQTFDIFGTLPNNTISVTKNEMSIFSNGVVEFYVEKENISGWKWNQQWTKKIWELRNYSAGHIISLDQYHFGTYTAVVKLPNFRGSWPAIWMIDVTGKMHIPPEIDIFEHFRKDSLSTLHKLSCTYHDGPTYENNINYNKNFWSCRSVDKYIILITLVWTPLAMHWYINDEKIMTISAKMYLYYPQHPMNILMGTGIGDWKPQYKKFSPFKVMRFNYKPL